MSPRIAALARIVIFAFVVILIPAAASAQTCRQPVIVADPDVCPGSFGTATAEAPPPGTEYTAFEWSIVNGTLPSGNTSSSGGRCATIRRR